MTAPPSTGPLVVLVGPPGSGKSSVGRALARMTGTKLRDTDSDIQARAGRPIPDIFYTDGEPAFRQMERRAVADALAEHTGVLALGGGAILAPETRQALAGRTVVFLSVTMPTGVKRTGLASNRPLLTGVNPRATYKSLLDARLPLYEEVATISVQTDALTVDEVATVIIEKLGLS
ncbi:shikimate kinase [Nakamurella sp. GG22]